MRTLLIIILFFVISNAFAGQLTVCPECKIKSIQDAIELAQHGDEIIVEKGIYRESNIKIDKKLFLNGRDLPVIDGEFKGHIIQILSDSVTIRGFKIVNVGQSYTKDYAALHVSKSRYFQIENLVLENVFFGILVEKSHNGTINGNVISGNAKDEAGAGNGIHLWHSSKVSISNNEVFRVRDGIYFEFVTESTIMDNFSHDNIRYGLHFMFSNNDSYYTNLFTRNGAGVAVMFSKNITMTENTFLENWGTASYGLLLKEIYDAEITNNTFEQNTIGINLEGSTRINYRNNDFIRNGWAVKIAGACYANKFTSNNFLNNSFDISYNSKLNDNSFEGNYWSSYAGYDLDKDGIGDVPFRPVKLFSYIVNRTPETIVLLRSLFIDLINFSERVSPVFTPDQLMDARPLMRKLK
jgi:nitrous oxidase accessory protein